MSVFSENYIKSFVTEVYHKASKRVLSVEIQDMTKLDQENRWNTYYNVGHEGLTDKLHNMIWIYKDGDLQVDLGDTMHHIRWPNELNVQKTWYGRCAVNDGNKSIIVTINVPPQRSYFAETEMFDTVKNECVFKFHPELLGESAFYKQLFPNAPDTKGYNFSVKVFGG